MSQLIKALETMLALAADDSSRAAVKAEIDRIKHREETRRALDIALREYAEKCQN